MFPEALQQAAVGLLDSCRKKGIRIATAESCTGGLIAALLTDTPGSSSVFERGFVTYSNASKVELLGVDKNLIEAHGAVSEQVALAMTSGAIAKAKVEIALSVTGIAGPDGGTKEKPVGTVYIAVATAKDISVQRFNFSGNRNEVRMQSVMAAIEMLNESIMNSFVSVA